MTAHALSVCWLCAVIDRAYKENIPRLHQLVRLLLLKQLRFDVLERFELDGIAAGIQEKHGGLFAGLPAEANTGFDDESHTGLFQLARELIPNWKFQNCAEVRHRNIVIVDDIRVLHWRR